MSLSVHSLIRDGLWHHLTTRPKIFMKNAVFHVQFGGVVQMFNFLRANITYFFFKNGTISLSHFGAAWWRNDFGSAQKKSAKFKSSNQKQAHTPEQQQIVRTHMVRV